MKNYSKHFWYCLHQFLLQNGIQYFLILTPDDVTVTIEGRVFRLLRFSLKSHRPVEKILAQPEANRNRKYSWTPSTVGRAVLITLSSFI